MFDGRSDCLIPLQSEEQSRRGQAWLASPEEPLGRVLSDSAKVCDKAGWDDRWTREQRQRGNDPLMQTQQLSRPAMGKPLPGDPLEAGCALAPAQMFGQQQWHATGVEQLALTGVLCGRLTAGCLTLSEPHVDFPSAHSLFLHCENLAGGVDDQSVGANCPRRWSRGWDWTR